MDISLLREFQLDWRLAGKAERTAIDYTKAITDLFAQHPEVTLCDCCESIFLLDMYRLGGRIVHGLWKKKSHYK